MARTSFGSCRTDSVVVSCRWPSRCSFLSQDEKWEATYEPLGERSRPRLRSSQADHRSAKDQHGLCGPGAREIWALPSWPRDEAPSLGSASASREQRRRRFCLLSKALEMEEHQMCGIVLPSWMEEDKLKATSAEERSKPQEFSPLPRWACVAETSHVNA